jgi:hypothetical protein
VAWLQQLAEKAMRLGLAGPKRSRGPFEGWPTCGGAAGDRGGVLTTGLPNLPAVTRLGAR